MFGIAVTAAVAVACSMVLGQGVAELAGHRTWAWWGPGVGVCLILAVAGILIHLPGRSTTVVIVIAVLTAAALLSSAVRAALLEGLADTAPTALIALAFTLLPFAVSGRTGILGVSVNNDMSAHLTTAYWLDHHVGAAGIGALGGSLPDVGYPLGPHALTAALSATFRTSLEHAFSAVTIMAAPLIALVALGPLQPLRRSVRIGAALLVGLCYLTVSYIGQGAFKEALLGLVLVTSVLVTAWIVRAEAPGWRAGLPLGVLLGGTIHVYSYPGLVWPVGAVVFVMVAELGFRPVIRALPGMLLVAVVLIAPASTEIYNFATSPFAGEHFGGNLVHALMPTEGLGAWLNPDFRFYPHPIWPSIAVGAVAVVALLIALVRSTPRGSRALAAGLLLAAAVYAYAASGKSIYVSGKALAIAAPLAALTILVGLLVPIGAGRARRVRLVVAIAFAFVAVASSFLALRDARVGPTTHELELAALKIHLGHHRTLFLGKDDYAQWELHGANLSLGRIFYAPNYAPLRPSNLVDPSEQLDFDNFSPRVLDRYRYVITINTPYQSAPPRNWHRIAGTRDYELWERHGRTRLRYPLDVGGAPGSVLDCNSPLGRQRLATVGPHGAAALLRRPVTATQSDWHGMTSNAGDTATLRVHLPAGHWDLSMQYVADTGLDVTAGPLHKRLSATLDRLGPWWHVGELRMPHSGYLTVHATARPMNGFAELLGAPGHTRALNSPYDQPLGGVAFTRRHWREREVPVAHACGHYVDWLAPPASRG